MCACVMNGIGVQLFIGSPVGIIGWLILCSRVVSRITDSIQMK